MQISGDASVYLDTVDFFKILLFKQMTFPMWNSVFDSLLAITEDGSCSSKEMSHFNGTMIIHLMIIHWWSPSVYLIIDAQYSGLLFWKIW